jgi:short subunit dehydrogenase-like uncharacterized protein
MRDFDVVLYGATGFVGKLTAEYLAAAAPAGTRIALAGRSEARLREVRDSIGGAATDWGLVRADATDQTSLDAMAARTQVVVTTVGPYTSYGLPLVEACAKAGTDYADLTGESLFVRDSIDGFHKEAADTGARIVHSCGFDSIPSDLGVHLLFRAAAADDAGTLEDTTLVVRRFRGGVSGGTVASGIAQFRRMARDKNARASANDPYTLSDSRAMEPNLGRQRDAALLRGSAIDPSLPGWAAGFIMAPYNTRIVRRSNSLLHWAYGPKFRYREVLWTGESRLAPVTAAAITGAVGGALVAAPLIGALPARALDAVVPKPGTGPSEDKRRSGFFQIELYTRTATGARYRADVAMQGDPGYAATAVMLGESGLCLALDRAALPDLRGVLTPATAMGDALVGRLRRAGATLEAERL